MRALHHDDKRARAVEQPCKYAWFVQLRPHLVRSEHRGHAPRRGDAVGVSPIEADRA